METRYSTTTTTTTTTAGSGSSIARAVNAALLLLLLLFSSVPASSAIPLPLSRSLKSLDTPPIYIIPGSSAQLAGWRAFEGRKLRVETNDYDGTGANNKHDPIPRSP